MEMRKQNDSNECGLVVVQSLHKHLHDNWIDINELKSRAYISENGMNINNLIDLANNYGLKLEALKGSSKQLFESGAKDYLIALTKNENENHYVIIKLQKNFVKI